MPLVSTSNISLTYTPPGAPQNSGVANFSIQSQYNASSIGQIDVNQLTMVNSVISVPFGSVNKAKLIMVKNNTTSDVSISVNGSSTPIFKIAQGAVMMFSSQNSPADTDIASIDITILTTPSTIENILYYVFGD